MFLRVCSQNYPKISIHAATVFFPINMGINGRTRIVTILPIFTGHDKWLLCWSAER